MSVPRNTSESRERRSRRRQPSSRFRKQVPEELVAWLIGRLLVLVARGLALLLEEPSETAQQWLKQHPDTWFGAEQVPYILLWVAMQAWETDLARLPEYLDEEARALLGPDFRWDPVQIEQEFAPFTPEWWS